MFWGKKNTNKKETLIKKGVTIFMSFSKLFQTRYEHYALEPLQEKKKERRERRNFFFFFFFFFGDCYPLL